MKPISKQMDLTDRIVIEVGLHCGHSFKKSPKNYAAIHQRLPMMSKQIVCIYPLCIFMEIIVEEQGNVLELANIYVEIQPANVRVPYVKSMIVMNYVSLMWLGTAVNQIILHMFVTIVPKRIFVPTRDLRRKTTYRKRKRTKSKNPAYVSSCRIGRTYEDFTKYMESKDTDIVVEMDTVIGRKVLATDYLL